MGRQVQHHIEAARARVPPQSRKIPKSDVFSGSQIPGSQIGPVTCTISDATASLVYGRCTQTKTCTLGPRSALL